MDEEQPDGAAGGPVETGAMLGVLRDVGLVGPKLALQVGNEEQLTRQVAERAGVAYSDWAKKIIAAQVKDAMQSMELDLRVAGSSASPSVQGIQDAIHDAKKRKEESKEAVRKVKRLPVPVVIPTKGKMLKLGRPCRSMARLLEPEEEKVLRLLRSELEVMGAPVLEQIAGVKDVDKAYRSLLGQYRHTTVKRYLAYWQNFRLWVVKSCGSQPKSPAQLVDYLHAREEEGMGPYVPLSVSKAVAWFEKTSGVPAEEAMSADPLLNLVVRDLLKRLEDNSPPRKRAPRLLSCFIPALEKMVMDRGIDDALRLGAWMKLLKVWASFRFDDLAHLKASMVKVYDGKMSGLLKRTKTTGGGKRVKELPFHIAKDAWIKEQGWLMEGWKLSDGAKKNDELLLPAGSSGPEKMEDEVMSYQEAVAWSSEVLREMKTASGHRLVPDGWERFWTEHSERATVSSALASLGTLKSDRDLLGRWAPEGSDQYVRTYNAVVGRLQARFGAPIKEGVGYTAFDEGAVLEDLKTWLQEKWAVDAGSAETAVEHWKEQLAPAQDGMVEMLSKGITEDLQDSTSMKSGGTVELDGASSSDSSTTSTKKRFERLSEERESG